MFWVSEATGRYYTDQGLDRTLAPGNPRGVHELSDLAGEDLQFKRAAAGAD